MKPERTWRALRASLFAFIAGCTTCAGPSADWPLIETFTDCEGLDEVQSSMPTHRGMVVADREATSVREAMAPVHASCRDGSMIGSNTWGWRRDRLLVLDALGGAIEPSRIVVFTEVGEFGPEHENPRWPRVVCSEEENGVLLRRASYAVIAMVGGGYALPDSELALLEAHPSARSILAYHRGRRVAIDGVPISDLSWSDLCG